MSSAAFCRACCCALVVAIATVLRPANCLPMKADLKNDFVGDFRENLLKSSGAMTKVLGKLESSRITSITTHPSSTEKLLYSDETRVYEFDLHTGVSVPVAGVRHRGLRTMRSSQDGLGSLARFVFITKITTRGDRVYVFDNNHLRVIDFQASSPVFSNSIGARAVRGGAASVRTISSLSSNKRRPVTGVVSHDASSVYWYTVTDRAGAVYTASLSPSNVNLANTVNLGPRELLSYQRSSLSYSSISLDDSALFIVDESYNTIRRIDTITGATRLAARSEKFGAIAAAGEGRVLAVDLSGADGGGQLIEVDTMTRKSNVICGTEDRCLSQFSYLQDVMVVGQRVFVVDAAFWPRSDATLKELFL